MPDVACEKCAFAFPEPVATCPTCAWARYPNVVLAQNSVPAKFLATRFDAAVAHFKEHYSEAELEAALHSLDQTHAVIVRPIVELNRLAISGTQLYSTYYKQIDAELRLPDTNEWDVFRRVADEILFPGCRDAIRFAALSINGLGPSTYGDAHLTLKDEMISFRSTVFVKNSAQFVKQYTGTTAGAIALMPTFRATWEDKGKLSFAKLEPLLEGRDPVLQISKLLLVDVGQVGEEEFIEVHIYGPLTINAVSSVVLGDLSGVGAALEPYVREKLTALMVSVTPLPAAPLWAGGL
jgi:hypothetical protein